MSDLLIRNFDSPKYGYREIRIHQDGHITEVDECGLDDVAGMAEYLPPHGRLIDTNALWVEINKICDRRDAGIITDLTCLRQILSAVRHAPTVIPAEIISENEIKIIGTKGKSNYDPKRRFVIPTDRPNAETKIQQEYIQNWHEEDET